jgi:hypothetical protein
MRRSETLPSKVKSVYSSELVAQHMVLGENVIGGMLLEGIVDCSLYQLYSSYSFRSFGMRILSWPRPKHALEPQVQEGELSAQAIQERQIS